MEEKNQSNVPPEREAFPIKENPLWFLFADLYIHNALFEKGIVIISPTDVTAKVKENEFFYGNGREFAFSSSHDSLEPKVVKKTTSLLSQLITYSSAHGQRIQSIDKMSQLLFNKNRREEVFFPLIFGNEPEERTGLYLYPWANGFNSTSQFTGFTQFVTAGCMFGASMKAITNDGVRLELINHHIALRPWQVIESIEYDTEKNNPFEIVLFDEFSKLSLLVNAFSILNQPKQLLYHIPAYDYILFGVKLFIHKQMTFEALHSFVHAVYLKQEEYQRILSQQSKQHGIEIHFISPFDNLFASVDKAFGAQSILDLLKIDKACIHVNAEEDVVQECLVLLKNNTFNIPLRDLWIDFTATDQKIYCDIESLFKIANALVIGMASKNKRDYEVCSLLHLSEKQIQVEYSEYQKKYKKHVANYTNTYPITINLTLFEPIITYSSTTNGLLFYFACCQNTLSNLLTDKKITQKAAKNIGFFNDVNDKKIDTDEVTSASEMPVKLISILGNGPKVPGAKK